MESTDEYVIRVTCDEDGTDVTVRLTPEQFSGVKTLILAVEEDEMGRGDYWVGPSIIVLRRNGTAWTP